MRKWVLALAGLCMAGGVQAQERELATRVDKLEREMRAVQRKVFPGGDGQFFEPQIAPPTAAPDPAGAPASTPIADLTARVSAVEGQLRTLTGQSEQNAYKIRQLEQDFARVDARLRTLDGTATPAPAPATEPAAAAPEPAAATAVTPTPAAVGGALDGIERPETGDAAEDDYVYGYRLWDARQFPQAQAQLKAVVDKHPKHKRASFAQNLLGRAYLDDGKPALASVAFYDNYQKMPKGERAPDSLYYLGVSLTRLKKLAEACQVYDEFDQVYGATASASLKTQIARGRSDAKCGA